VTKRGRDIFLGFMSLFFTGVSEETHFVLYGIDPKTCAVLQITAKSLPFVIRKAPNFTLGYSPAKLIKEAFRVRWGTFRDKT